MNGRRAHQRSAIRCGISTTPTGSGSTIETSVELPTGPAGVTHARLLVDDVLRGWGFQDQHWLEQVALVVTELVANAVDHAGGCRAVILRTDGNQVTVAAVDTSPTHPRRREPDGNGGRGLTIVEALSTRWGVCDRPDGKHVWATFHRAAEDR
jgi:anti-sigma regulatory factor (Ser/Thr protein kinase)